jgi:cytochrome c-type biogenesis protein CcmH
MSFLPPWLGLLLAWLLLGVMAAGLLWRGLNKPASSFGLETTDAADAPNRAASTAHGAELDVQAQAQRRIQQEHLADLTRAWHEGRLSESQYAAARDDVMRQVLSEQPRERSKALPTSLGVAGRVRWVGLVVGLCVLSGLSYLQLGAPQSWWPVPLSQRVQISATTPEQLSEQTRVWQQATQSRPEDAEAWLTLARLQAAQGAHGLAEQALARVLVLSPEPDLWIERAQMKALSAGGVYAGEPWQWIQNVLREQPQHLNALVLAGSAALAEQRPSAAQTYWQQALALVPADSEAAQGLQQALSKATEMASRVAPDAAAAGAALTREASPIIQGEVRVAQAIQGQIPAGAVLFVYAVAEEGSRRPVAIWRGTPSAWPVRFVLSDNMGMGAPPVLSSLAQVRLVARISATGSAQKQEGDWQVELPGVKTGVQGVVLNISGR